MMMGSLILAAEVLSACASDRFETSDEQTPSRQGNGA